MGAHKWTLPHGYRWKCIDAPRTMSTLIGHVYRKEDLEVNFQNEYSWAEGLIFYNTKKHITCKVEEGRLVKIEQQLADQAQVGE